MNQQSGLLYLSKGDMERLDLAPSAVVQAIETFCKGRELGQVRSAPKATVRPDDDRLFMSTLAAAEEPPFMAVKSLGMNAKNAVDGRDIIGSLITLFDSRTGQPLAVMDGNWITALRTAGLSAVVAKHMAQPDAATIAFIGCGTQARSHLDAFAGLFPLKEIRALGRGSANRDALCTKATGLGLNAVACQNAEDAISSADIVISTVPKSTGLTQFLDARWLKPGAFASLVDLGRPWLPQTFTSFDRIVIDDAVQEAQMPDPMLPLDQINGDIQDLVAGRLSGRDTDDDRTVFLFRGLALGDLALAALAYQSALDRGTGRHLER